MHQQKVISYKTQAQQFIEANIGDYFYLTHGTRNLFTWTIYKNPISYFSTYTTKI